MITLASKRYTIAAYNNTLDSRYPDGGTAFPTLPQLTVDTTYSLPTGTEHVCTSSAEFTTALSSAARGDVITLQAGTTFAGPFTLPTKSGTGWIYIRSSAHASLPAAGTRVAPADAANMPIIQSGVGTTPITIATGASHWRVVGAEIRPTTGNLVTNLVNIDTTGATTEAALASHIIFDRCYAHGHASQDGPVRAFALNGASCAVIDSYVSECKKTGSDSQGICAWSTPGPLLIHNNYVEGAAENIMIGGSDTAITNCTPSDITVTENYLYKPTAWKSEAWAGNVKNLFELKHAKRVLFQYNTCENTWAGGQQHALVLTVRNQDGSNTWATVEDVSVFDNRWLNVCGGINGHGTDDIYESQIQKRIRVLRNLFVVTGDDLSPPDWTRAWACQGLNGMQNLRIEHNTFIFSPANAGVIYPRAWHCTSGAGTVTSGFVYRDNITYADFVGDGTAAGAPTLGYWYDVDAVVTYNLFTGATGTYPATNSKPANDAAVGFTNFSGADYSLDAGSSYKSTASDGTDPGASGFALTGVIS